MYLFDIEKLKIGDIILMRSDSRISELVRRLTKSQYSHAILYVEASSVIDSDGYGVQSNNIQRLLIKNLDDAIVLRLKKTPRTLNKIEEFARQKIGTQYSTDEAKAAAIKKESEAANPNRQFCTRFIAQSYQNAGINLVENPDYCVPEELLTSEKLYEVKGVLRKANQKEIEFAKSENPLDKQKDIHNTIFKKARELSGKDIQTFEQIIELVIEKPEYDSELTEFITQSGYLNMMEIDIEKNPWHYDSSKMISHYKNPVFIIKAAKFFANSEAKTRERLILTIEHLIQWNKTYPRKLLEMEIKLYEKLISYSMIREEEAIKVLKIMNK